MDSFSLHDGRGRRKYVTEEEGCRFLQAAAEDGPEAATLAALLASTGCRITEALRLTASQLDPETGTVTFLTLKRREMHWRSVPVHPALMERLCMLAEKADPGKPLWSISRQTAWRQTRAQMHRAGIEGPQACPKGLRHGFAVSCVMARLDPRITQQLMGHSNEKTTAIYLEVLGDEARALLAQSWAYQAIDSFETLH